MTKWRPRWPPRPHAFHDVRQRFASHVPTDTTVYFRLVFATVALSWVIKQYRSGAIDQLYVTPRFHFDYFGFSWIPAFPAAWTYAEFAVMFLAAIGIGLGLCYRVSAIVFAVGFTHCFLLDKTLYQNHYYLLCLVAWLLTVIPAHRALSVDAWLRPPGAASIPFWCVFLLRFQLAVPYFYGGLAKLNADWLAGEPMRMMLAERADFPLIGQAFTSEWCVTLFAYGGLLFDLLIVPALMLKRLRWLACLVAILFHAMNSWLFTIGVFPWFMALTLPIFFEPGSLLRLGHVNRQRQPSLPTPTRENLTPGWTVVLVLFVSWQLCFPLRHYAIAGNPSWTEEGHYFSWHMLLRGKRSALRLIATDPTSGRTGTIDLRPLVTEYQLRRLARDPRMICQLVHHAADDLREKGFGNIEIRVLSLTSLNGRRPQHMIFPDVNLAAEDLSWRKPEWIVPLTEPLRSPPWDLPLEAWESAIARPPSGHVNDQARESGTNRDPHP